LEERGLLHRTIDEIMMMFGIPDADYRSIMAYCRRGRTLILVFGLEERDGRMVEAVQGYACRTEEGTMLCEGIRLFDDSENAQTLPGRMDFRQLCQQYTVVDVGSGAFRPAMIDKQLSIWFVRQDRQGKILGLKEKKLNAQSGSSGEADEIYQQLLNMKTPPAGADKY